jgi:probable rRNA maturation factor
MILLDPNLDPDHHPAPKATSVGPRSASASCKTRLPHRTPSARSLAIFLGRAQAAVRLSGHASVLLTTDSAIRRLNRQFRGLDKPTDVLSFPAADLLQDQKKDRKKKGEKIAGDLAISVPTARRQAVEQGHSLSIEIKVLILHGLLHLGGYDHESDSGQMARRERRLRAQLGLPLGLIERSKFDPALKRVGPTAGGRKGGKAGTSMGNVGRTAGAR